MSISWYNLIYLTCIVIIPIGLYNWRKLVSRVEKIENEMINKTTEDKVRLILNDKVTPIQDSLKEIKEKIDDLISYLLKDK